MKIDRGAIIGLITATILGWLALQAEPISAIVGWIWAALHLAASIRLWIKSQSS